MPKEVNLFGNRPNRLGARFPNLAKMGDALDGLRNDVEKTSASIPAARNLHPATEQATGGTRFYNKANGKQEDVKRAIDSSQKEKWKKKADPYTYRPTNDDITRAEEAKVVLGEISKDCEVRHTEDNINLAALERIFTTNSTKEPYFVVIGLVLGSRRTLAKPYLEAFDRWLKIHWKTREIELNEEYLTEKIRRAIFDYFFIWEDKYVCKLAFRVFNLAIQGEKFVPDIKKLICAPKRDYKTALSLATELKVQDFIALSDIVIPAILLSVPKEYYESYLQGNKKKAEEFVQWLDNLYEDNSLKLATLHATYTVQLPKLDFNRLNSKGLDKFVKNSVEVYDLPPEVAPKFTSKRRCLDLRYFVIHDRYGKRTSVWRDLVDVKVKDNYELQLKLIDILQKDDLYEAVYWAQKLNLSPCDIPSHVLRKIKDIQKGLDSLPLDSDDDDRNTDQTDTSLKCAVSNQSNDNFAQPWIATEWSDSTWFPTSSWSKHENFFELPLPDSAIVYVDDGNTLAGFINYLEQTDELVFGLDTEFTPVASLSKPTVSILQIATMKNAYILDMISLVKIDSVEKQFSRFIELLFNNAQRQVVGYGLSNDWIVLGNTHLAFKRIAEAPVPSVIDLFELTNRINKGNSSILFELPYAKEDQHGLNGLTQAMFNKRLNKSYQVSNWSKRPLLPNQITYAALDAFICVKIFKELGFLAQKFDKSLKFDEWCATLKKFRNKLPKDFGQENSRHLQNGNIVSYIETGKESTNTKEKKEGPERNICMKPKEPLSYQPIEPPNLKVVCDNMLQGLCKKLRIRGVDAIHLESYEHFEIAKDIAEKEGRMILTKSSNHASRFKQIFRPNHVLLISAEKTEEQVKEVFWYFTVNPDEKYVFSRCPKCNNDRYIKLENAVMLRLHDALNETDDNEEYLEQRAVLFSPAFKNLRTSQADSGFQDEPCYIKCDGGEVEHRSAKLRGSGVQLKIKDLHSDVVRKHTEFFGCIKCGQIFWEGSHWDRYLGKTKEGNKTKR